MKRLAVLVLALMMCASVSRAQQADVMISLNEQFFDSLLDALFKAGAPEFPLALKDEGVKGGKGEGEKAIFAKAAFNGDEKRTTDKEQLTKDKGQNPFCNETIKLEREIDGVKTAVRFRDGQIYAPIAFKANYNPPLVGCIEITGWAETLITLEFDNEKQSLVGRAKVTNVQLSGTRGIGSSVVTRLVQNSIDKKINPLQILQMDKVSFAVPVQNSATLKMKAVGMRHELTNGALNVFISYQFQ
ncbi:MAG TPA: hypothetical protein PKY59_06110 [Pyrinomonadaceae bacterium]|nr:hypothetical protein [Pyrinomonadaceae bacterium]